MFYAIAICNPNTKDREALRERIVKSTLRGELKEGEIKIEGVTIFVNRFHLEEAQADLNWALEYWSMKREAIPTKNHNKCKKCEYLSHCNNPDQGGSR